MSAALYLNVVVECAVFVPVLLQEPEGIVVPEVFKLDEGILPVTGHNCLKMGLQKYCLNKISQENKVFVIVS